MLTVFGRQSGAFCDRVARRSFLKIGALATCGLTLADLLRADALAGPNGKRRSIINIYLPGGPSHMDTFDLKPEAPAEFRGDFRPIDTNVPGMQISEHLPQMATLADKLVIVRSVMDFANEHSSRQSDSGWSEQSLRAMGGRPGLGAVVAKVHGPAEGCPLASIALSQFTSPGYLGATFKDYQPDGAARANLRLQLPQERIYQRQGLLSELDRFRRDADRSGTMAAADAFTQKAVDVVTSGLIADALDTDKESAEVKAQYRLNDNRGGANRNFLTARKLVEAGVRVVSFSWGGWDTHGENFKSLKNQLPALDAGVSALMRDLDSRGLLDDTLILISGEFGRTPRINNGAGRDHWPAAGFVVLGGGGLRTGQVIGSTNRLGERPQDRPVHLQQVFATIYRQLGIDVAKSQFIDSAGRPQYIVDHRETIGELA